MAAPPDIFVLGVEDVAGLQRPDRLLSPLNGFIEEVSSALQGLTFAENFLCTIRTVRLAMPSEAPWVAIGPSDFANSWTNFGSGFRPAAYQIGPAGRVRLRGFVSSGVIGSTMFTLPVGYRPSAVEPFGCPSNAGAPATVVPGFLEVRTNGTVVPTIGNNTWFSLGGVEFDAVGPAAPPTAFTWTDTPFVAHGLPSVAGVLPIGCKMKDATPGQSNGAFTIDWEDVGDGRIKIKSAWGLQWGQVYFVNLLIFAG